MDAMLESGFHCMSPIRSIYGSGTGKLGSRSLVYAPGLYRGVKYDAQTPLLLSAKQGDKARKGHRATYSSHTESSEEDGLQFEMEFDDEEMWQDTSKPDVDEGSMSAVEKCLHTIQNPEEPFFCSLRDMVLEDIGSQHQPDLKHLARSLADQTGNTIKVRSMAGSRSHKRCLKQLRHSFLLLESPYGSISDEDSLIIDPCFRQQFLIAHPTSEYADIMKKLPEVFIGWMEELEMIVSWACKHLEASILRRGRFVPPWRRCSSTLTKWMSQEFKETAFYPPPSSSEGALTVQIGQPVFQRTRSPSDQCLFNLMTRMTMH